MMKDEVLPPLMNEWLHYSWVEFHQGPTFETVGSSVVLEELIGSRRLGQHWMEVFGQLSIVGEVSAGGWAKHNWICLERAARRVVDMQLAFIFVSSAVDFDRIGWRG